MCTTICATANPMIDERRSPPCSEKTPLITSQNGIAVRTTDSPKPMR